MVLVETYLFGLLVENYGLGVEDPPLDDFERAQEMCNRWEDAEHPEYWDSHYDVVLLNIKGDATNEK